MKNILLVVLILITSISYGQITITAEQGYIPFGKLPYTYIKNKGTAFPDTGKNMVWNYSDFVPCDNCESIIEFKPNKNKDFSNSDRIAMGTMPLLGFPIPTTEYYQMNKNGDLYLMGKVFKSKTIPLRRLTGHPMDRLKVKSYDNRSEILDYDFPFEYGKKWKTISMDTINLVANTPSVNMMNLEIQQINSDTVYQSIVGYGKLTLPYFKDGETQTFTYDALLLKKVHIRRMRLESDLEKAEFDYLLQLVGVKGKSESTCITYKFYIRELSLFVLALSDCSEKGIIQWVRLRTDLDKYPPKEGE